MRNTQCRQPVKRRRAMARSGIRPTKKNTALMVK